MRLKFAKDEISLPYKCRLILCKNGYVKLRQYKEPIKKIKTGYELEDIVVDSSVSPVSEKISAAYPPPDDVPKEIERRSLNKTKNYLIELASENAEYFHSFVTLTFADNVTDISVANKAFKTYISSCKRHWPDFKYLGVPEYQKRGAVHYHLLTSLRCGVDLPGREPIKTYNASKKKYFDLVYYDLPHWTYGFSSAFDVDMTDSHFNIALYMTKYLFKDIDNRLWGHKKILKSNDLQKPDEILLMNNAIYKNAMRYIKEKGYDFTEYQYVPDEQFIIPFIQLTATLRQEDCSTLKKLTKEFDIRR